MPTMPADEFCALAEQGRLGEVLDDGTPGLHRRLGYLQDDGSALGKRLINDNNPSETA